VLYLTCGVEAGGSAAAGDVTPAIQRFERIVRGHCGEHDAPPASSLLARFHHMSLSDTDSFEAVLLSPPDDPGSIHRLLPTPLPGLMVVDSLAGLYRNSYSDAAAPSQIPPSFFFRLSASLRTLPFHTVLINQVKREATPCFGLPWSCCVNARVALSRHLVGGDSTGGSKFKRYYKIAFGGEGEGEYRIEEGGVVDAAGE
jgi:hypothetical protein